MGIGVFDLTFVISAVIFNLLVGSIWIGARHNNYRLMKKLGIGVLSLSIPLTFIFINYLLAGRDLWIIVCFVLIFVYLFIEVLLDFILKIEFRDKPVLHVPYIVLFYIVEFGFIRISFYIDRLWGYIVSISFWLALVGLIYLVVGKKKDKKKT